MNSPSISSPTPTGILWVEDDQDVRELLADELADAGYTVVQAANGREALNRLRTFRPDLILCDVAMPMMDGFELLRAVRETLPDLADVPFVFLSAQDGSSQISQGKYAGADDYLVKPVNFDLMLATIAARIRQVRRMRSQAPLATPSEPAALVPLRTFPASSDSRAFLGLTRMFNLIPSGLVVLDSQGRILFTNIAAQQLMRDCTDPTALGIFSTQDGLKEHPAPASVIRNAITASREGLEHTEFLSVPRRNGQRDLLVTICALDSTQGEDDAPAAALFIGTGERNTSVPLQALDALFKLTPTEGRIAWAFAQGLRPEQIAEAFSITPTTVAFHKRNIFQKTQTNRQADLIALLLTLPAAVEVP